MKIRELRLKNLNSLYGEWEIDFSDPAYEDSGIFLITGPTGAGKTTVLDAISLALYGKTPRLAAINASSNEIMSRHSGDCYAEVVFETNEGLFQSRWSQRRAKSKVEGNLQSQKREISQWNGKENQFDLLESYTSRVDDVVQEKTGMTFGRFTRSMLLAQGQFAAFLEAKDDERSETLEQITGTEIYTSISRGVFERHKLEKEKLDLIEREVDGISQLSDDCFFEMEIEKSEKDRVIKVQQKQIDEISAMQEWLRSISSLKDEIKRNALAAKEHQRYIVVFGPKRQLLAEAAKAEKLRSPFEALKSLREQVVADTGKLRSAKVCLEKAENERTKKLKALSGVSAEKKTHQGRVSKEQEIIKQVRQIDTQISAASKVLAEAIRKKESEKQKIEKAENELSSLDKFAAVSKKELAIHAGYLAENKADELLISKLPVVLEQGEQWQKSQETTAKLSEKLPVLKTDRKWTQDEAKKKNLEVEEAEQLVSRVKKQIETNKAERENLLKGKQISEFKTEEESLEERLRLEEKIINLEAERSRLAAGEKCPLCGSTEHPYAGGDLPEPSRTRESLRVLRELLQKLAAFSDAIQILETKRSEKAVALEKLKGELSLFSQKEAAISREIKNLEGDIKVSEEGISISFSAIEQSIKPFGMELGKDLGSVLERLKKREETWKYHEKEQKRLSEASRETSEKLASLKATAKALRESQEVLNSEVKSHESTLSELQTKRGKIYGNKDPDNEELRIQKEARDLDLAEKAAAEELVIVDQKIAEEKALIKDLSNRLNDTEPKVKESVLSFEQLCSQLGFKNEEAFLAASLPGEEIEMLKKQAGDLDKKAGELNAIGEELKTKLEAQERRTLTKKSIDALEKQKAPLIDKNREFSEMIGQLTVKLEHESANREKKRARLNEFAAQRNIYAPWKQLNQLIGSADGKKYRNFAQGLTFEVMVGQANQQLARMTDRYLLQRDEDPAKALTLNVVDHYQGGEVRPTTNLSGGETFLVSLALALGLSQMASEQVRVDSLFLDEGFGTLDEDTLEEALDALATLKKEEKLIGVISHVPALKERLSVQLKVDQQSGGKSLLSGPGVSSPEPG